MFTLTILVFFIVFGLIGALLVLMFDDFVPISILYTISFFVGLIAALELNGVFSG